MEEELLTSYIATLPRHFQGPNARRVVTNLAHGGARLRAFMRRDRGPVAHALACIADQFGAVPRTLRARTSLSLVHRGAGLSA